MAILATGNLFATNDQVTAAKLNNMVNNASFDSIGAVDSVTTQLSGGAIAVKDGGITPAKLSTGGPSWDANGNTVIGGTTTNDSAAAGKVGEIISSLVAAASGVSLTTATAANVTSISLTAGDWDVSGFVFLTATGATNITGAGTLAYAAFSSTSATLPGLDSGTQGAIQPLAGNGYDYQIIVPTSRFSVASTTTVYLIAQCNHNGSPGDVTASGSIRARRMR